VTGATHKLKGKSSQDSYIKGREGILKYFSSSPVPQEFTEKALSSSSATVRGE
jgi:hypothetical protein